MKKFILLLGAILPMSLFAQQHSSTSPDTEGDDVQLEMITPAQPVEQSKDELKNREKQLRQLYDDIAYAKAANSLRRGYFVLLADEIRLGSSGYRYSCINQTSNFILTQGDDGIIQYAINTGSPGSNGLGGWTGKGTVKNKRIETDDNGDVHMSYQLVSGKVNATIFITLFHNTNQAVAHISGGPSITIYGQLLPYRDKKHR